MLKATLLSYSLLLTSCERATTPGSQTKEMTSNVFYLDAQYPGLPLSPLSSQF